MKYEIKVPYLDIPEYMLGITTKKHLGHVPDIGGLKEDDMGNLADEPAENSDIMELSPHLAHDQTLNVEGRVLVMENKQMNKHENNDYMNNVDTNQQMRKQSLMMRINQTRTIKKL